MYGLWAELAREQRADRLREAAAARLAAQVASPRARVWLGRLLLRWGAALSGERPVVSDEVGWGGVR